MPLPIVKIIAALKGGTVDLQNIRMSPKRAISIWGNTHIF